MPNTEKKIINGHTTGTTYVEYRTEEFIEELEKAQPLRIKATDVLRMIVQKTGATYATVFQVHERHVLPRRYHWPMDSETASNGFNLGYRNTLDALGIQEWEPELTANNIIAERTANIKGPEQDFLQRNGAKSFIIVPIITQNAAWWGFLEVADTRREREWDDETRELLQTVAAELGKAMYDDEFKSTMNMSKTDLIELRLREEMLSAELEEINRWKNQMLSAFSHEFQTPLYTLLGFSKTLLENEELDDDKEIRMTCLNHIYDQSRRLEKLVNNLMFASRLHAKSIHVEKQPVDFRNILNAVGKWSAEMAKESRLEFYTEFPENPQPITCDPGKIERMLQNILENALGNTPSPGWVSMKVIPETNNLIIIIADTGTGISKERIGRIFEPFFSAPTTQTSDSGVGLGLSIAKEIVDLHNGFITVESKEGEGSVFTITLPRNNKESVMTVH